MKPAIKDQKAGDCASLPMQEADGAPAKSCACREASQSPGAAEYAATVANGTDKPQRVTLAFEPNKSAAMTPSVDPSSLEFALGETNKPSTAAIVFKRV